VVSDMYFAALSAARTSFMGLRLVSSDFCWLVF